MTKQLTQAAEQAAQVYQDARWNNGSFAEQEAPFMAGVQWLYAQLLKNAPEFDEAAALEEYKLLSPAAKALVLSGARWQFEQLAAQVEALRAERAGELALLEGQAQELDRLRAEVERLEAEVKEQCVLHDMGAQRELKLRTLAEQMAGALEWYANESAWDTGALEQDDRGDSAREALAAWREFGGKNA